MSEHEKYGYIKLINGITVIKNGVEETEDKDLGAILDAFIEKIVPEMSENEVAEILIKIICIQILQVIMKLPMEEAKKNQAVEDGEEG